jgi:hypothetical protein
LQGDQLTNRGCDELQGEGYTMEDKICDSVAECNSAKMKTWFGSTAMPYVLDRLVADANPKATYCISTEAFVSFLISQMHTTRWNGLICEQNWRCTRFRIAGASDKAVALPDRHKRAFG